MPTHPFAVLTVPELEPEGTPKAFEASRCFSALAASLGVLLHQQPFAVSAPCCGWMMLWFGVFLQQPDSDSVDWTELAELFGEKLRPFIEKTSGERPGLCGIFLWEWRMHNKCKIIQINNSWILTLENTLRKSTSYDYVATNDYHMWLSRVEIPLHLSSFFSRQGISKWNDFNPADQFTFD